MYHKGSCGTEYSTVSYFQSHGPTLGEVVNLKGDSLSRTADLSDIASTVLPSIAAGVSLAATFMLLSKEYSWLSKRLP
jgi:hypothetical protein